MILLAVYQRFDSLFKDPLELKFHYNVKSHLLAYIIAKKYFNQ